MTERFCLKCRKRKTCKEVCARLEKHLENIEKDDKALLFEENLLELNRKVPIHYPENYVPYYPMIENVDELKKAMKEVLTEEEYKLIEERIIKGKTVIEVRKILKKNYYDYQKLYENSLDKLKTYISHIKSST